MDITFRTLGPWGPGKGANLQPSEVDSNFWSIAQAIVDLQSNPALPNGIASITVSGTQMTIYLNDGTVLGPFTLPVLTFRWRGEWEPGMSYQVLDVFTRTDVGIFMVEIAHISGDDFDPGLLVGGAPAYLQLFGSTDAGLSGLNDVLLTNLAAGDALVWGETAPGVNNWFNIHLGGLAYQESWNVSIQGGLITGMPTPVDPSDVATKAYVDSLPAGSTTATGTMMSNISGTAGPALPNTLTDYLDYVLGTGVTGAIMYRSGTGWVALPPGTVGYFLKTRGAGLDPLWDAGGAGVTSVTAGAGLAASPNPIIASGTVALAAVASGTVLANTSGTVVAPSPVTMTALLDAVMSNARGSILMRAGGGWVALAAGTPGYYLKTQGPAGDPLWDAPAGTGTVTSISAGTGISTGGAPITGVGTVSLASVANLNLLANISGGSAAPIPTTATLYFDAVFGTTQGAVLYRNAGTWVMLSPGTSGQVLTTGGAAANPAWANAPSSGPIATGLILGNISGSTGVPSGVSPSAVFDAVFGSARGMVLYRGTSGWAALAAGTSGQVLTTGGTVADPTWATPTTGGGASITISDTPPASPSPGNLWFDSVSGQLFVYYNDGTSAQWVIANSPATTTAAAKYNIGFSFTAGVLTASQLLGLHRVSKAITIPANFASYGGHASQAGATASATASTVISVDRALAASPNTFSQVGTITIGAGGIAATFATSGGAAVSVAQGDVIRLTGPATPDATLANFYCTLVAQEA